jgi:hypothetical protein
MTIPVSPSQEGEPTVYSAAEEVPEECSPVVETETSPSADSTNIQQEQVPTTNEDDDDMTIIGLEQDPEHGTNDQQSAALAWIEQNGPEMEERRRNVLLRELQRVQRASFIHFILLCLIPTSLLFIVVATVLGESEDCYSEATHCQTESRTFINAFTTRCICDAIDIMDGQN